MRLFLLLVTLLTTLTASANAQWIKEVKKDPVTEKTNVYFRLPSKGPEKVDIEAICHEHLGLMVFLFADFQIRTSRDPEYPQNISFPGRFDDDVRSVPAGVRGDLDDYLLFAGEDDGERILRSKRIVLQITEFGGRIHNIVFRADVRPPLECKCAAVGCSNVSTQ